MTYHSETMGGFLSNLLHVSRPVQSFIYGHLQITRRVDLMVRLAGRGFGIRLPALANNIAGSSRR